ncbi:EAL domain-containing protein, partial [Streptomyces acidiscabies]|uniref:EAL domain-containing protein n=1 Tax=Streptomyces acidiscabies TaxID=42234 RepID=UPI0038F68559
EELVGNAQLALEQARSGGFARFKLYTPHLRAEALARRRFDADIRRAFAEQEFVLHYQPQVRLSDEQVVGVETLLRWHHPERG